MIKKPTKLRYDTLTFATANLGSSGVALDELLTSAFRNITIQFSDATLLPPVAFQTVVVSNSYCGGLELWHTDLTSGYQELGEALVEMQADEEFAIEAPVYQIAHFVATALMESDYPAPKLFTHGPKSVVFNWENEKDNLYVTVSDGCISALLSSPERIKRRFEVSSNLLEDASRIAPAIKYVEQGEPVMTMDGSLDILSQATS